ncbi:hypothetical protein KIN20_006431 [Parelaphostrongylus tenuis]|uniref:Uncharacterized protein n=1 Tax=Parelaphostrongylus tenuis TaxID=148309 RepID=A0AAD5QIA9_PARTN|nr:hypothetical protein KIN20_006431 [Parelaphostrongylus tenuis]
MVGDGQRLENSELKWICSGQQRDNTLSRSPPLHLWALEILEKFAQRSCMNLSKHTQVRYSGSLASPCRQEFKKNAHHGCRDGFS